MKTIKHETFSKERSLYNLEDIEVNSCVFGGSDIAESPLKECKNVKIKDSVFELRYANWHDDGVEAINCFYTEKCRAAYWYSKNVKFDNCNLSGVKAFRECDGVIVNKSKLASDELFWRCKNIHLNEVTCSGNYDFFESDNVVIDNMNFEGKYSFQYVNNLKITNSKLNTKDAFWHAKNVIVEDSEIIGQYLGWYSENVTLIRCKISSTQPLCYCKNLTLIDCTMEGCDLAFEYSDVKASIIGNIASIKNPLSGEIVADSVGAYVKNCEKYGTSTCKVGIRKQSK